MMCAECLKKDRRVQAVTILMGKAVCEVHFPEQVEAGKNLLEQVLMLNTLLQESSQALTATSKRMNEWVARNSVEPGPKREGAA
jgi:ABC-type transport system involved in Fe-S cluster assembly fused permease/ATPase subunit